MPSPVAFVTATYLSVHSAFLVSSLNRLRPQMARITLVSAPIAPRGHQWWSKQFLLRGSERSVSRLPPVSWVQLLKMTASVWIMQQLPALAWSMMYATCARADIKEKGQRLQASDQKTRLGKKRKAAMQQLKQQRATGLLNKLDWTPALCRSHLLCLIVFTDELLFAFVCSCSGLRWRCTGMFYSKENYTSVYNDSHNFK